MKFFNIHLTKNITFLDILRWKLTAKKVKWPKWVHNNSKALLPNHVTNDQIAVTYINHATCLIQTTDYNILTDPVWSHRVSPFTFVGPKRVRHPGIAFDKLPKIDIVLISHNHYDHLDLHTLKRLEKAFQPYFFAPLGNRKLLTKHGLSKVQEFNWWDSSSVFKNSELKITLVPAQHFSGRGLHDRDKALWGGFVFELIKENPIKVFFAGDTGYASHFKQIYEKFGAIDVSLLPIGAYEPSYIMQEMHMNPKEAVLAHLDLHSRCSIPIHYGTFQLTDEGIDEPLNDLAKAIEEYQLREDAFKVVPEGETFIYAV